MSEETCGTGPGTLIFKPTISNIFDVHRSIATGHALSTGGQEKSHRTPTCILCNFRFMALFLDAFFSSGVPFLVHLHSCLFLLLLLLQFCLTLFLEYLSL